MRYSFGPHNLQFKDKKNVVFKAISNSKFWGLLPSDKNCFTFNEHLLGYILSTIPENSLSWNTPLKSYLWLRSQISKNLALRLKNSSRLPKISLRKFGSRSRPFKMYIGSCTDFVLPINRKKLFPDFKTKFQPTQIIENLSN